MQMSPHYLTLDINFVMEQPPLVFKYFEMPCYTIRLHIQHDACLLQLMGFVLPHPHKTVYYADHLECKRLAMIILSRDSHLPP